MAIKKERKKLSRDCHFIIWGNNSKQATQECSRCCLFTFVHERAMSWKNEDFSYFFSHSASTTLYIRREREREGERKYRNMQEEGSVLVVILHAPWNFFYTFALYVYKTRVYPIIFFAFARIYISMSDVGSNNKKRAFYIVCYAQHTFFNATSDFSLSASKVSSEMKLKLNFFLMSSTDLIFKKKKSARVLNIKRCVPAYVSLYLASIPVDK